MIYKRAYIFYDFLSTLLSLEDWASVEEELPEMSLCSRVGKVH